MTARELIHFLTEEFVNLDDPVMVQWMWCEGEDDSRPIASVRSHHGRIDLELG